jgi:hypothetical protein
MVEGKESQDSDSAQGTASGQAVVTRTEIFELYKYYEAAAKEERDFFFRYLHFYTGLFSAILAVTLTGLLSLSKSSLNPPLKLSLLTGLLIGPILIIILDRKGFPMLAICFRRFLQAWVTAINLQAMLGFRGRISLCQGTRQPIYKGEEDSGFIAQFEPQNAKSLQILRQAKQGGWSSEKVLNELLEHGDQLGMARTIFRAFEGAAITVAAVIAIAVLLLVL